MSSTAERIAGWEFQTVNRGGKPYGAVETAAHDFDIQERFHQDYWGAIAQACEDATENPGEWQEIILGPPLLADAVDRLRIRWPEQDGGES
jgi:hypothetical protein